MVRFFQKKETDTQLTHSEIEEIKKGSYDLGFEVGYHKHSEIGWVSEQYSMLEDLAKEAGLGSIVIDTYKKGKEEGARAKERDVKSGFSKKEADMQQKRSEIDPSPSNKKYESKMDSGYGSQIFAYENRVGPIQKPSMTALPKSTSRIKSIEKPTQTRGPNL